MVRTGGILWGHIDLARRPTGFGVWTIEDRKPSGFGVEWESFAPYWEFRVTVYRWRFVFAVCRGR